MRAVNLLPRDSGHKAFAEGRNLPLLGGVCAGVLVAAVMGSQFMMQSGKLSSERQNLDALKAKVAALPPVPAGPTPAESQLAGEHSKRVTALSTALGSRVAWDRVFRDFSLVLPDDVWLTALQAQAPVSPGTNAPVAGGGAPTMFVIQGHTYSHDGVARLLSRLQVVPELTNVQLQSSTLSSVDRHPVIDFSIAADIKPAGGGS
jgi:Tfp pilus assembly protein PilN